MDGTLLVSLPGSGAVTQPRARAMRSKAVPGNGVAMEKEAASVPSAKANSIVSRVEARVSPGRPIT